MEKTELIKKDKYKPVEQKWLWTLFGIIGFLSLITLIMTVVTVIILSLELGEVEVNEVEITGISVTPAKFTFIFIRSPPPQL